MVSDPIQTSLLKLIDEKKKALEPKKGATGKAGEAAPVECRHIMDALRRSVEADLKGRKAG